MARTYHKDPPCFEVQAPLGGSHFAQSPRGLVGVLNKHGWTLTPEMWERVNAHYKQCAATNVLFVIGKSDLIQNPLLIESKEESL